MNSPSATATQSAMGSLHSPIDGTATIELEVNGVGVTRRVNARLSLADFLRERLDLTGTHLGCEHGVCGACTVVLNDEAVRSCLILAVQADGSRITTIEGLAETDHDGQIISIHPIQRAMQEAHGFQCAFCAPGFLMTALCFLERNPAPTRAQIREEISGNLCRCTGYQSIIAGVETAVEIMAADRREGAQDA